MDEQAAGQGRVTVEDFPHYKEWRALHADDGATDHDNLCPFHGAPWPTAECLGCELVNLRSDAVYGLPGNEITEEETRDVALAAFGELLSVLSGHLEDALTDRMDPS